MDEYNSSQQPSYGSHILKSFHYLKNLLLVELFFPKVFLFHNSYNYIRSLCFKIQFQNGRCLLLSKKRNQFNQRPKNMMTFCDNTTQWKAHFSPNLFEGKNLIILLFVWSITYKFLAKHLYEFQMVSGNPGHPVCLRSSWELQCSICDMILSCYKRDFIFNMRISGEKFETLFIQDIFYNIFQIFCISLHKADSIMDIVVQLSDVSHVPLF